MDVEKISQYITGVYARHDDHLDLAFEKTPQKGLPAISIKPEEGRFLQLLTCASGAGRALEIGTLGGYSAMWIVKGLCAPGRLITLEREPEHAQVALEHFRQAGIADRIEILVGDAHNSLKELDTEPPFDFVFIDAEKSGYTAYYEWAVQHVRPGGIITAHNVLRRGRVADYGNQDQDVLRMREFNQHVADDRRVISTIFPAGDGLLMAVKM
jgi:caffeoyl-CoA O-methyltransferase